MLNLAQALLHLGDDERAGDLAAECRRLGLEIGDPSLVPVCDFIDAVIAGRAGDRDRRATAYAAGERTLGELGITLEQAEDELRRLAGQAAGVEP